MPFSKEFLSYAGKLHPDNPFRERSSEKLRSLGFKYVTIDLQGFRSGSLNEALTQKQKRENR